MSTLWLLLSLSACAAAPPVSGDGIGVRIDDFSLRDAKGEAHRLADWWDRKLVVVVFLGVDCPLAKLYAPRLTELAHTYQKRGVGFLAIAPNRHDSAADLGRYQRQHRLPFPLVRDVGQVVADRFAARRSPEVFVLDPQRRVRYRGRIDDQYAVGVQKQRATRRDLVDALEALLAGKPVAVSVTEAPGCPIARAPRDVRPAAVTYCRDVAPILQKRCQVCHRRGQSAPFALTSYREAAGWAQAVREVVEDRRMPPWGANPRHGKFANDPSLTAGEKDTLFRWIDAGCPEGDAKDLPPPATFATGWSIPGPDLVVSMPEPFTVPAEGTIEYQYIRVDPGFKEDRWVRAAEVMPSNRAVVHHCNVFLQPPGYDDPEDLAEAGKLGSYCLTMTASGTPPLVLPAGMAKRIPAGWKIVFVMHYQAIGSVQKDQTRLALTFCDPREVKQEVATRLMYDLGLCIPPRVADHRVSQTWEMKRDVLLLSLFPHMHLRGKSFRYDLIHPDGREEILLDVPRFDFNWQHRYVLDTPRRVAAGSRLRCTAVFDNSADNPANPDPDAEVRAGKQSWEEMFNGYFDVCLADEDLRAPVPWYGRVWQTGQEVCRPGVALLVCLFGGLYLGRKRIARALAVKPAEGPGADACPPPESPGGGDR
jgi:peroxiredoxin